MGGGGGWWDSYPGTDACAQSEKLALEAEAAAAERARRGARCRVAQSLVEGAVGSVVAVVLCGCSVVVAGYAGKCCLWVFLRVCGFDDPGWFDWRVSKNIVPEGLVFGWVVLLGWLFCCYRPARARS